LSFLPFCDQVIPPVIILFSTFVLSCLHFRQLLPRA